MKKTFIFCAVLILIVGLSFSHAQAWRGKGRMSGTVKDASGNPLEGVVVRFESEKLQSSTELKTDKKGSWLMAGIQGGDWTVSFTKEGFKTETRDWQISSYEYNKPQETVLQPAAAASVAVGSQPKVPAGPDVSQVTAGRDLLALKDYAGAIAKFQEGLTKNPDLYQIYGDIARAQYEAGQPDEAIKSYEMYLQKDKEAGNVMPNQQVLLAIVGIYMDKKDMVNAKKYMEGVDESAITDPTIFYNMGVSSTNAGDIDGAIKFFEKSIVVDPKFMDGYYQLAISYVGKGNNAKAIENFKKVIELDPTSDAARDAKDFIKMMGK
jgi:Tfp pilus assembly protein PilF